MKKSLLINIIIIASTVAAGIGGGFLIKRVIMEPDVEIADFDINEFLPDLDTIDKKVSTYKGSKDIVDSLGSSDIINYTLQKYRNCENCFSYGVGVAKTIVSQKIRSFQIKVGNTYLEENASKSSMVGISNRMQQDGIDASNIKLNQVESAKDVEITDNSVSVKYKQTPSMPTKDEYKEAYGRYLDEMFIYVISDKTILNSSLSKKDNYYEYKVGLNENYSTYFYKKQMKTISSLDKEPTFKTVDLTFKIDKDLNLIYMLAEESYKAVLKGLTASIDNTIEYYYYPNEIYKGGIIDINTGFDYSNPRG